MPDDAPKTLCPQCGAAFTPTKRKRFCTPPCQVDFNNRMAAEGKILAPLVKAMFATRGGGNTPTLPICGRARSELTRIARMLNDADKAAGRPPVHQYVQSLLDSGTLYMDRCRRDDIAGAMRGGIVESPRRKVARRPTERIEVPGGPFTSEDDAVSRGFDAMKDHCRAASYPFPGAAAANPDPELPGTFKLNGFYVTDGNNKRLRTSHYLVARGV